MMEKKYEAIFIIRNLKEQQELKYTIERINNMIISEGCEIFKKEEMGLKKLAYEIKGTKEGYYYLVNFKDTNNKKDVSGRVSVKINTLEEVLKHIILKMEDD